MTVPCSLTINMMYRENAPFGVILCAARSQRCGAVKTRALHYCPKKGFFDKLAVCAHTHIESKQRKALHLI